MSRNRVRSGALWLGLVCAVGGVPTSVPAAGSPQVRGVLIPIYAEGHPRSVASIRIERVFRDHRRMGFFRVKALPVAVAEGVRLELREPTGATNLLADFSAAMQRVAGNRAVELRDFRFVLAGAATPRLQARRLSPSVTGDPSAFLLEGVTLLEGAQRLSLSKATAVPNGAGGLRLSARDALVDFDFSSGHFTSKPITPIEESP